MNKNLYRCPKCGSDNIQSYEMIYNGGRASHESTTDGFSVGSDWSVGHATTSGNSVSHLAKTCAPPVKKEHFGCGCLPVIIVLSLLAALIHPIAVPIVFIALSAFLGSMNKDVDKYNATEYARLYREWKNSYLCHKCGNRFIINDES